jgi:UDP-N-acetyl-D-glucosamine dehydrogenase
VVVLTEHSGIDWSRVVARAQRVYDTRNATRGVREGREKIKKL